MGRADPLVSGKKLPRNAYIDLLRGFAIIMVMLLHFSLTYRPWHYGPLKTVFGKDVVYNVLIWGNFGVTIFFVVSGYLITSNALRRYKRLSAISMKNFYVLRFARLQPLLILSLSVITVLGLSGISPFVNNSKPISDLYLGVLSTMTFWQNILMQYRGYFNYCINVYWSLSVEDMFYLLFPIVCTVFRRDLFIAIFILALITFAPFYRATHEHSIFYLYANLACFDAIGVGCLCAMLATRVEIPATVRPLVVALSVLIIVHTWLNGFVDENRIFSFSLISAATGCLILAIANYDNAGWTHSLPVRCVRWFGRHSYELYLFHIIVLAGMRNIVPAQVLGYDAQIPWLILFFIVSSLIAGLAARFIGDPANRNLRERFLNRRIASVSVV
ncbi:acyltransferase family protein [Acidiphilium acidophilum]|uniref:Acyltransferase n=1 Tax=Acidiphilium acidophilum TaxID=76588 RepID=A0AAW9DNZ4_ACIAO|nr:acyltransferase [Acidiphilium acidophilum]MDX5930347.1 acyltransferase [Acidiphilium acidophilum]